MARQRAVNEEQKQARQQTLLDVAWDMFQELSYPAITINAIAERAGLAKGTVYLYFPTKEALFLNIQQQQLTVWFNTLDTRLGALNSPASIDDVVTIFCETLEGHPGMTRLLAILHTVLEQNIDFEQAREFKLFLHTHLLRSGALLERALPFLAPATGIQVMLQAHVLVIGFRQLAEPAPVLLPLLAQPELAVFDIQFAPHFSQTFRLLLQGWQTHTLTQSVAP